MLRWVLAMLCLLPAAALADEEPDSSSVEAEQSAVAVQERLFPMSHELVIGVGYLPSDAFYKGISVQLGYLYHFSDHFAWQVGRGLYSYNLATSLQRTLERQWGATPHEFQRLEWMVGSDLVFSPIYGKSAVMNKSLVWFEGYLLGGASVMKMNNGFAPSVDLGVGARVFGTQHMSIRLDVSDHYAFAKSRVHVTLVQLSLALNFGGAE